MAPRDYPAPMLSDKEFSERYELETRLDRGASPLKMEQAPAGYSEPAKGSRHCVDCVFYNPETETLGTCQVVQGVVHRNGVSDLFTTLSGVKANPKAWMNYQRAGHKPPPSGGD